MLTKFLQTDSEIAYFISELIACLLGGILAIIFCFDHSSLVLLLLESPDAPTLVETMR